MLEQYFVHPETVDRIRSSWIGGPIEHYVQWLQEHGYRPRNVFARVPILTHFGEFARARGAKRFADLPEHIDPFVAHWTAERGLRCKTVQARKKVAAGAVIK